MTTITTANLSYVNVTTTTGYNLNSTGSWNLTFSEEDVNALEDATTQLVVMIATAVVLGLVILATVIGE